MQYPSSLHFSAWLDPPKFENGTWPKQKHKWPGTVQVISNRDIKGPVWRNKGTNRLPRTGSAASAPTPFSVGLPMRCKTSGGDGLVRPSGLWEFGLLRRSTKQPWGRPSTSSYTTSQWMITLKKDVQNHAIKKTTVNFSVGWKQRADQIWSNWNHKKQNTYKHEWCQYNEHLTHSFTLMNLPF